MKKFIGLRGKAARGWLYLEIVFCAKIAGLAMKKFIGLRGMVRMRLAVFGDRVLGKDCGTSHEKLFRGTGKDKDEAGRFWISDNNRES